MKRLIVTVVVLLVSLTTTAPSSAYFADFSGLPNNMPVQYISNIPGMTFSGADWTVVDLSLSSNPPFALQGNTIGGCMSALTIEFDRAQRYIDFDFEISDWENMFGYEATVTAYFKGMVVSSASYGVELLSGGYKFPEGYASLGTRRPFDAVVVTHNAPTNCLYIDHIETVERPATEYGKMGQVQVNAPGVALYQDAGGSVVRDAGAQEIWIPNQTSDNPDQDVYDVIDQVEIDGVRWVQIFVGNSPYPWIPVNQAVTILD